MNQDFCVVHQHWFILCLCLAFFPRITLTAMLLLTAFVSGGFVWWLGFIFAPRLLIAFLSLAYWDTNPWLVVFAWVMALSGESAEKGACKHKASRSSHN